MRPQDTEMASGEHESSMEDQLEENYAAWREVWDLDNMTPREIYAAGFMHGFEFGVAKNDEK